MVVFSPPRGVLLRFLYKRVNDFNKNLLLVITGGTGSGKSYSALRLGELLDPNFSIKNVAFTPKEFMDLVNSPRLGKGSVIVFDEAGVGLSSREYMTYSNRLINYVTQTFRHKNYIVIFTTPDLSFIDAGVRKLFHAFFETLRIDFKRNVCVLRPYFLDVNQRSGKIYFKYLRDGNGNRIVQQEIGLASDQTLEFYEKRKEEYTHALNTNILKDLSASDGIHRKGVLTDIQKEFYDLNQKGLTDRDIARMHDITRSAVSAHRRACEKKGWKWQRQHGGIVKKQLEEKRKRKEAEAHRG